MAQKKVDEMSISIKSRKAKGRRLQQDICKKISEVTGLPWGKDTEISSREMGQSGTDVRLIGKALEMFPYSVECKSQESVSIWDAIEQAKSNQKEGTEWLLFLKRNNVDPIVVMSTDEFFNLIKYILGTIYETTESVPRESGTKKTLQVKE
jgi:hypothetical protein